MTKEDFINSVTKEYASMVLEYEKAVGTQLEIAVRAVMKDGRTLTITLGEESA